MWKKPLCFVALFVLLSSNAHSDLILNLTGSVGSNVVNYNATGSVVVTANTPGFAITFAHAPIGGAWAPGFDNDLGNFLRDGMNTSLNDNLALSNPISYRNNGVEFVTFDGIDFDGEVGGGGDDVELDILGANQNLANLTIGDTLSWTGSGTLTLEDGETWNTLFNTSTGVQQSFSRAIDGGFYTVTIQTVAVPEPSSMVLLFGLTGVALCRRRKR